MQLILRRRLVTAGDDSHGAILDSLKALDGGRRRVRRLNGSGEIKARRYVGSIRLTEGFLAATPRRSREGTERGQLLLAGCSERFGVFMKMKMRVVRKAENRREFVELERSAVDDD